MQKKKYNFRDKNQDQKLSLIQNKNYMLFMFKYVEVWLKEIMLVCVHHTLKSSKFLIVSVQHCIHKMYLLYIRLPDCIKI